MKKKIPNKIDRDLVFRYFSRPIGRLLIKPAYYLGITSIQLSLFMMFLTLFSFGLIAYGKIILATILLQFCIILDMMDGTMAKLRNQQSVYGRFLSAIWHNNIMPLFFLAVGFHSYKLNNNIIFLIIGILTSLFIISINLTEYLKRTLMYKFSLLKPSGKSKKYPKLRLDEWIIMLIAGTGYIFTYALILSFFGWLHYMTIPYFIFYTTLFTAKSIIFLKKF